MAIVFCLALVGGLPAAEQGEIDLPASQIEDPISIDADHAEHWKQGVYEVWVLHGNCLINQGLTYARADDGVIWVERGGPRGDPPHKVIAYLEGNVAIDYQEGQNGLVKSPTGPLKARVIDKSWLGRWYSAAPLKLHFQTPAGPEPAVKPPVYEHGMEAREPKFRVAGQAGSIRPTEFGHQRSRHGRDAAAADRRQRRDTAGRGRSAAAGRHAAAPRVSAQR